MKIANKLMTLTGIALLAALVMAPVNADAGRFRGAGGGTGIHLIDTDGDGVGDTRPTPGTGMGANAVNFVDADGDGVCDTYAAGGQNLQDGSGAATGGRGYHGGRR